MKKLINAILGVGAGLAISLLVFHSEQLKDDFINMNRSQVIEIRNLIQTSGGTGFFVKTPSGKIKTVTNGHVCRLAGPDGGLVAYLERDVEVIYVEALYEDNDLCILSAPTGARPLKIASSVRNTENVYVLGFPLLESKTLVKGQVSGARVVEVVQGYDIPCEGKTYKKISVSEAGDFFAMLAGYKYMCIRVTPAYIATTNILPGNSGSPVFNAYGHVVGVAFAGSAGTSRAMIVPLQDLNDFLKDK